MGYEFASLIRNLSEFRKGGTIDFFPFFISLCNCSSALIIAFIKSDLLYFLIYLMSNDFAILNSSDKRRLLKFLRSIYYRKKSNKKFLVNK
jgi:hypothetical protein